MFWRTTHPMLLTVASALSASQRSSLTDQFSSWVPCSALALTFLRGCYWSRAAIHQDTTELRTLRTCTVQIFFRSFMRHPQLVFATALIKLIFLSDFFTVSSTFGLNDIDLSNVTLRNLGVQFNSTIFSPILMKCFHSNSKLDSVRLTRFLSC